MFEQLNNTNSGTSIDIKCTKADFTSDVKLRMKQIEEKSRIKLEILSNKLEIVCEKLRETDIAFNEAKNIINHNLYNIESSVTNMKDLTGAEHNPTIQKLIDDCRAKDEELYFANKKIKKLQRENQCNFQKINKLKIQLRERNLIKEHIQLLEYNYNRFKGDHDNFLLLQKKLDCMYQ